MPSMLLRPFNKYHKHKTAQLYYIGMITFISFFAWRQNRLGVILSLTETIKEQITTQHHRQLRRAINK